MISTQDIASARSNAETVTQRTDHVVGSTSLPDFRSHLSDLENAKDALLSCENELQKTIDELKHEERELYRLRKKVEDHWARTKTAGNDVRFSKDKPKNEMCPHGIISVACARCTPDGRSPSNQ